jgi:hypothetical protein
VVTFDPTFVAVSTVVVVVRFWKTPLYFSVVFELLVSVAAAMVTAPPATIAASPPAFTLLPVIVVDPRS